jgi:adenine-specific DNA-methyltransferase
MKKVFIGGSRRLPRLNDQIRSKLREIMERNLQVVIGDANGADRAVQAFLAESRYPHVTVYYVGARPRNNEGGWVLERVTTPKGSKGFEFFAAKDRQMAADSDCGLMIWDGHSRGTLANVENLVRNGKPVSLYLSKARRFQNVVSPDDLAPILHREILPDQRDSEALASGAPAPTARQRSRRRA